MKTEGQIRQKAKQVIFRHRKEVVRMGLARSPVNCKHNGSVRLPAHMANRAVLHVCQYASDGEPNDIVCDSSMDGARQAAECPYFVCRRDADELKARFNADLGRGIGYLAKAFPDVAALMWVMGPGKDANRHEPEPEIEVQGNILAFFGEDEDEPEDLPERPLVEEEPDE